MNFAATVLAAGYGLFMGSYPVPIKSPAVQAAGVHPLVFQSYKSFWVMATGFLFIIPVYVQGHTLQLSPWAILSAACWVPSGLCTVAGVMLIGVSLTIVISCAVSACGSFLVFWLIMGEQIKQHKIAGLTIYLAPVWLAGCLIGMIGLVYGPGLVRKRNFSINEFDELDDVTQEFLDEEDEEPSPVGPFGHRQTHPVAIAALPLVTASEPGPPSAGGGKSQFVVGLCLAACSGCFGSAQYAVVTIGRSYEEHKAGCQHSSDECPDTLKQAFDPLGSWSFTFGLGAAAVAALFMAVLCIYRRSLGRPLPRLEQHVMRVPGTIAGLCWCVANLCGELSTLQGGNMVEGPTMTSIQLITSGVWGIVWYHEVEGRAEVAVWVMSAVWTVAMVLLLGMEKKS